MPESLRPHGPVIEPTLQPSAELKGRKDQFLRDKPDSSAVIRCRLGSFPFLETRLIPSSRCLGSGLGRLTREAGPSNCILQSDFLARVPDWWSQTGSNRRPPACKAGALPTELWPRSFCLTASFYPKSGKTTFWNDARTPGPLQNQWWAWVDLNYRPHAYQACALTGLSYRPMRAKTGVMRAMCR